MKARKRSPSDEGLPLGLIVLLGHLNMPKDRCETSLGGLHHIYGLADLEFSAATIRNKNTRKARVDSK
jgi:hypothetical protein